jgi:predicted membrane-bound dolichyl-phosphate-mannose-protein mannosyltransferase
MTFLLLILETKSGAHSFWILFVCAYPLGNERLFYFYCAANAVCKSTDILNKYCILLRDIIHLFN